MERYFRVWDMRKWDQCKFRASSWTFSFIYISFQTRYSQTLTGWTFMSNRSFHIGWVTFAKCILSSCYHGSLFLDKYSRFMMSTYNYGHILWILLVLVGRVDIWGRIELGKNCTFIFICQKNLKTNLWIFGSLSTLVILKLAYAKPRHVISHWNFRFISFQISLLEQEW
jgi:hypothetical protein